MMDIPWDMTGRLILATALGACIGLERELHGHPAGLRTHILVSLGSAIAALVSVQITGPHGDPGRVAAQVVTGVGFLGAGAIIREGASIRGLTTAASIWTTAMVGLAVGGTGPTVALGIVATGIILAVLWWMHRLEILMELRGLRSRMLEVEVRDTEHATAQLVHCAVAHGVSVHAVEIEHTKRHDGRVLHMRVKIPSSTDRNALIADIADVAGVRSVTLD